MKSEVGPKVICPSPEIDYPFLDNLPKKCNILLKPSKLVSTPTESKFQTAFQKFLNGKLMAVKRWLSIYSPHVAISDLNEATDRNGFLLTKTYTAQCCFQML